MVGDAVEALVEGATLDVGLFRCASADGRRRRGTCWCSPGEGLLTARAESLERRLEAANGFFRSFHDFYSQLLYGRFHFHSTHPQALVLMCGEVAPRQR